MTDSPNRFLLTDHASVVLRLDDAPVTDSQEVSAGIVLDFNDRSQLRIQKRSELIWPETRFRNFLPGPSLAENYRF